MAHSTPTALADITLLNAEDSAALDADLMSTPGFSIDQVPGLSTDNNYRQYNTAEYMEALAAGRFRQSSLLILQWDCSMSSCTSWCTYGSSEVYSRWTLCFLPRVSRSTHTMKVSRVELFSVDFQPVSYSEGSRHLMIVFYESASLHVKQYRAYYAHIFTVPNTYTVWTTALVIGRSCSCD